MNQPFPAVDFGKTATDYARFRAGFPPELFARLAAFGIGEKDQQILDLGTGTGYLARGLLQGGSRVTGIDRSLSMLRTAVDWNRGANDLASYVCSAAECLPFSSSSFDVVSAGQCWHWFDREAAAKEVRRVLKPDGIFLIAHFDWLPRPGDIVEETEHLILAFNPLWRGFGGDGMHARWLSDVLQGGFGDVETFSFDAIVPYSHEAWRGRIRASAGVAASLKPEQVAHFDQMLTMQLATKHPQDPLAVLHRTFTLICRNRQ